MAAATGDSATLRQLRNRFPELPTPVLYGIHGISEREFPSPGDAETTLTLAERRASTAEEQYFALMVSHDMAMDRGQPQRAVAIVTRARVVEDPNWTDSEERILVYDALYQEGDTSAGRTAAEHLAARASRPLPADRGARARRYFDLCAAAQWRLAEGQLEYARQAAQRLARTRTPEDAPGDVAEHRVCGQILRLRLALAEGTQLEQAAALLDSLLTRSPWVYALVREVAIFTLAEAQERLGDSRLALATMRRRELGMWNRLVTTRLREEGRLAAITGDTASALGAFERYLAIRDEPEASLAMEVSRVRQEFTRLEAGRFKAGRKAVAVRW
jgi:hypothetical protein